MVRIMNVQLPHIFGIILIILLVSQVLRPDNERRHRVMFYNVENLFHPSDDPMKEDDEFTPDGSRAWDRWKYREKLIHIYKVVAAVGAEDPPVVIGLCEIESAVTLRDLTQNTPLRRYNYQYVHFESPDRRGIDVGLLYRPDRFTVVESRPVSVSEPENRFFTRDLLYVKGTLPQGDTIHLIVAHWPSRYGGYLSSRELRLKAAASTLKLVDSVLYHENDPYLLVMGDFNDTPSDSSLKVLCAKETGPLNNLMDLNAGSIKHQGNWFLFDQILSGRALLDPDRSLNVHRYRAKVYQRGFLLEKDEKWLGYKPFRSFSGYRYRSGFSDHLPVYLDLVKREK